MGARVNSRENYIAVYLNFRNLQSKEVFHAFHTDKEKIEKDFGRELVWDELPDAKECTIYTVLKNTDFRDEDNWQNQFSWIKESLESLDRSFRKRIRDLVLN
jgi:RNAse (barnase) inhibitor barstar